MTPHVPSRSAKSLRGWRAVALVSVLGSLGCRAEPTPQGDARPSERQASLPRDHAGPNPQRLASRTVLGDELLWSGETTTRPRIVGISNLAEDARYSTVAGRFGREIPRLGANPEQLLALRSDLILLASFTSEEYRAAISGHVEMLVFERFTGFDSYLREVERFAEAVGEPELGRGLLESFERRRAEIATARDRLVGPPKTRPTCLSWTYGNVAGKDTTFHDAVTLAGFRNRAALGGLSGHHRLDTEQMLAWEPDFLVISCGAMPCDHARTQFSARPGLTGLAAVREGRVIAIPTPYLSTTGAGMLELAALLQNALTASLARGTKRPAVAPGEEGR